MSFPESKSGATPGSSRSPATEKSTTLSSSIATRGISVPSPARAAVSEANRCARILSLPSAYSFATTVCTEPSDRLAEYADVIDVPGFQRAYVHVRSSSRGPRAASMRSSTQRPTTSGARGQRLGWPASAGIR